MAKDRLSTGPPPAPRGGGGGQVAGGGDVADSRDRVVDRVRAGREVRFAFAEGAHEDVELLQRLAGRQLQVGERVHGRAEAAHGHRGAYAVTGDVADDHGDPSAGKHDRV